MPVVKYPRAVEPLWHEWDGKAQKCGLRHTVYAVNGDQYTGEWLDNLKHGKGTQIWKRTGAIYSGDWKFGKRDGYGSYSIPDPVTKEYKKVYTGWWKNDKKCGYGTMFYPSGECYEGEWSGGLRSGWGRMCYGDGSVYEGQWLAGQPGGQGMLCLCKYRRVHLPLRKTHIKQGWSFPPKRSASRCSPDTGQIANENRYEGGWKDGKKHGPGRFFYLDKGQLLKGIWVADIPKCGIMIDFGRDEAPAPTQYPIPKIELADPDAVLAEAQVMFDDNQN